MNIDFFRIKDRSVILLLVSMLFQLVSLILYGATGLTEFTAELSSAVLAFSILSLISGAGIVLITVLGICEKYTKKVLDIGIYVVYLFGLLAWLFYITSQVNYLVNIFVAIDGTKLTAAFILTVLFFLFAWFAALVSAILYRASNKLSEAKANE